MYRPWILTDIDLMRAATFMRFFVTCATCLLSLMPGMAQEKATGLLTPVPQQIEVADTAIPDAPTPSPLIEGQQDPAPSGSSSTATNAANPEEGRQTKRILWIVPN